MAYSTPQRPRHLPSDLRMFREQRDMTQQQLADWLGVKANTVARWERGERQLPPLLPLVLALWEQIEESP